VTVLAPIRARLRDLVKARHPEFVDVDLHYGRLTPQEVRNITAFSPACRVGIFGSVKTELLPSGELKLFPRFAAVVLVRSGDLVESTDTALALAMALSPTIAGWCPGAAITDGAETSPRIRGIGLPEALTIEPSPAAELEKEGIALWGCLFTVPVVIGASLSEAEAQGTIEILGLDQYFPVEEAP
jgi:hypothetical protein